jgi:ArsR family transcriptional regulator, arsenate/arsenite/antimonite-responsive transcriptional repressor
MKQAVKIFKALSDATRIRMIKLLEKAGELCVCEILKALDISQTRASRNLNILKQAGLVKDRRLKMWVHYSINREECEECCKDMFKVTKLWLNDEPVIKEDLARLKKYRKNKC